MVTVVAPIAILAIWGGSYVWACVLALSAPGKPLEFKYKSSAGILRFWADSYVVDWDHGTARLEHPRIYNPAGQVIASADHCEATGIHLPLRGSIAVRVRGITATVTRLATGRFDIQNYLPERKGPPSQIPFSVNVNEADVTVVDLAGKTPFRQTAIARDIDVRGIGDNWIASGALELTNSGNVRAEVQNLPNQGVVIRGNTTSLQLARFIDHLRTTQDAVRLTFLKDMSANSIEVFGPVSVFIPKATPSGAAPAGKSLQIQARLRGIAKNVRFLSYSAEQAFFEGSLSDNYARGELDARSGGTKAKFYGSIAWRGGVVLGGRLVVDSPSSTGLPQWLHRMIPAQVAFGQAHFDGWLDYTKGQGVQLQGPLAARQATFYGQALEQPKLFLTASPVDVRIGVDGGRWAGAPIHGAVLIGVKSPTLTGALSAVSVDLATVADRFGARGLSGKAQVSLLLGGTTTKPTAVLEASGTGSYRVKGEVVTGRFQGAGTYLADQLKVDRLRVGTDAGSARAIGTISIRKKTLELKVDATNLRIEKLRKDIVGNINASGLVRGTFSDPVFSGHALALGVEVSGQQIPFISGAVRADKNNLFASQLRIVKGTGEATGDLALNFRTQALGGTFSAQNVLLNEYLGDQALGTVTVPKLTVAGTVREPHLAGTAYGDNLVVGGIRVDRAEIASTMTGTVANVDSLKAKVGNGSVTVTGKYDYDKKSGSFNVKGDNLALDRITPPGKGSANITGILNGDALATVSPSGTWRGKAKGTLNNVNLNDTEFGSGTWNLGYDGEDLTGNASVGKLDRFLLLENVDYNVPKDMIRAQVSVLNGSLQDLYTSTHPFFPDLSLDARQRLETAGGDLDTTVAFSGPRKDPDLDVKLLEARNLTLQGESLGSLKAAFGKTGTTWNIGTFDWTGPQGTLLLKPGFIDTAGDLHVDGELSNFNMKYIGMVNTDWALLRGDANLSFLATGRSASPLIHAALLSSKGYSLAGGSADDSFIVNLDSITVSQALYAADGSYTGGVEATGQFFYRGLAGNVVAHVPVNYPFEVPDGPQITASLDFPHVDVKDLAQYVSNLDTARSIGSLNGTVAIVGPKTKLALRGSLFGQADLLAFNDVQTTLKATVASVKLQDNRIVLTLNTTGSAGGAVAADLAATIPDLQTTLDQIAKGNSDTVYQSPVQGTIRATNFAVRQESKNKEFGTYHATVNSTLNVSGTAIRPLIKGRVGVTDTNILLPSVFQGAGPGADLLFNPHFEIPIELDEVARFRTGAADVSLTGGGVLTGSLARPNFDGTLTVQSGRLTLPTARVNIEEGGTLRPSFSVSSTGETNTRVDVNLEGTTSVTAIKFGDTAQRYDIRLFITGDLLSEGGLNLNATSDPPDLGKDEILALLGQTDVLKSIGSGSGVTQSETEARIRNALMSIAVPQLTQSLTNQLANNLGLQYLNIDYNALEGASIDFAKVLGKNLILQGRRQISPTVGNRKLDYDFRLTYRLPSKNVALSRVVFSVGMDQDRPIKFGVTYGFRF